MTPPIDDASLIEVQSKAFDYFIHEDNPKNGLVADKTSDGSPASIASVGMALSVYAIGVECGWLTREQARRRTLAALRFFRDAPQSPARDATGYKGFYYHFLSMETGRRAGKCELSTVDSAFLFAGMLTAAAYYQQDDPEETEIRALADALYRRADWRWATNRGATLTHGWRPESGFLRYRWSGYDEALLLYVLALGSPTHPLPPESYAAWLSTYAWRKIYDTELVFAGPLFVHQYSHVWVDFRGIQDSYMREKGIDYFENSRRASLVQREYAIRNPLEFEGYSENCWGITASDGPGWSTHVIDGVERLFFGYRARGAPFGPDDGTLSPWAVVASLPFAPEIVLPTCRYLQEAIGLDRPYGFKASFNPTYPLSRSGRYGWISPVHFGINQGPIVLMIENHRNGLLWRIMRECPYVVSGLRRAGFTGGWLATRP